MSQFLTNEHVVPVLHPQDSLATILDRLDGSSYPVLPVVDENNRLLGVVDLEGTHFALKSPHAAPLIVAEDLMRNSIRPLRPDDRLDHALELFVENDLSGAPDRR